MNRCSDQHGALKLITTADLKSQTRQDLANMARELGVQGWHGMRKDQLIEELRKVRRRTQQKAARDKAKGKSDTKVASKQTSAKKSATSKTASTSKRRQQKSAPTPAAPRVTRVGRMIQKHRAELEKRKDLSATMLVKGSNAKSSNGQPATDTKDRVALLVRDSFWLQATWDVQRSSVERARAALAEQWHAAIPVLRLIRVADTSKTNASEQTDRDIPVHGGVNNWYIDILDPPGRYQVLLGYLVESTDRFFALCKSNIVEPPEPGVSDPIDAHWQDIAEDYERIYSLSGGKEDGENSELKELFEDRLRRRIRVSSSGGLTNGADLSLRRERRFPFKVDAELIVFGSTSPGSSVTIAGEPVRLQPDGTFTVRMELPDRRQVLPVVASSPDGMQQRTTVVAVERNTKVMEPISRDSECED
ncbi:hypothetical protein CA51_37550 [Rosistilla oblonga]|uniref:Rho termination factor-like N-terminal domain-containing protein n=1 Tax=Rosistilla oblonga TaxID=2527990 RepID=A0A518IXX2_9BACT|nr:DUF4912 domain-containing protein [Rosistilla oblonga]QDV13864.1 hypothetical protein CA51_37550 [Rosistilla oblonga]QDV57933.1 hypothetical protein Mal33_39490 [Rosistilla oblonga]